MTIRYTYFKHGFWLLPTIGFCNFKYYYGYPVIGICLAWLNWELAFKFGVKKVEDVLDGKI